MILALAVSDIGRQMTPLRQDAGGGASSKEKSMSDPLT